MGNFKAISLNLPHCLCAKRLLISACSDPNNHLMTIDYDGKVY